MHYRLPRPGEERDEEDGKAGGFFYSTTFGPFSFLMPLWLFVRPVVLPLFEATVGNRPWIVASAGHPPVRMVWRAIGRGPASRAVDEIAEALARGETHPAPFASKWVGYDQGGVVMPPKS